MSTFQELHTRQKEATTHITITAKKEDHETGYQIDVDYSDKSIKLSNRHGIVIFLPLKLIGISFVNKIHWIDVPRWLYNKNYGFFNS